MLIFLFKSFNSSKINFNKLVRNHKLISRTVFQNSLESLSPYRLIFKLQNTNQLVCWLKFYTKTGNHTVVLAQICMFIDLVKLKKWKLEIWEAKIQKYGVFLVQFWSPNHRGMDVIFVVTLLPPPLRNHTQLATPKHYPSFD